MKLNLGDKVLWIDDDNKQKITRGEVTNVLGGGDVVIQWDSDRIINYSKDQLCNMEMGHYSGTLLLDIEAIRQDKLQALGI